MSWKTQFRQILERLRASLSLPRIAILGVGHDFRADDAVGLSVARLLQPLADELENLLVICAGSAPENCCNRVRSFAPDVILFVDAAQMDEKPGTVRLLPMEKTSGISASTHTLPLHILADYLKAELNCEIMLLGIQPSKLDFGTMSSTLRSTAIEIAEATISILRIGFASTSETTAPLSWSDPHVDLSSARMTAITT